MITGTHILNLRLCADINISTINIHDILSQKINIFNEITLKLLDIYVKIHQNIEMKMY
jgi:hypothetical protein